MAISIIFIMVIYVGLTIGSAGQNTVNKPKWPSSVESDGGNNIFEIQSLLKEILSPNFKPKISAECMAAGEKLLLPIYFHPEKLFNSTAGKMLDAFGKLPERLLLGNAQLIGAYDECSALSAAKYCASPAYLFGKIKASYGSCFPKECTTKDVTAVLFGLNNYTVKYVKGAVMFSNSSAETLCVEPDVYSTGPIATLALIGIVIFLCVLGTMTEYVGLGCLSRMSYYKTSNDWEVLQDPTSADPLEQDDGTDLYSTSNPSEVNTTSLRTPAPVIQENEEESTITKALISFSVIKNGKAILSTKVAEGAITSINGIRVISLTWVILGHMYLLLSMAKPDNIAQFIPVMQRFISLAVINAYVSVDSFFVLSGLLVSYLTLKRLSRKRLGWKGVVLFYVHRFIRLIPSVGMTILIFNNLTPLILSGPKAAFVRQVPTFKKNCNDYWWSTLFFFNNFYPAKAVEVCIGWTWYLSNDMQFYILSLPLILSMVAIEKLCQDIRKAVPFNFLFIIVLCLLSMISTGVITSVYDIPALMTAGGLPHQPHKGGAKAMDYVYDKPYTRIHTYLIGIFLGYVLSRKLSIRHYRRTLHLLGWIAAIIVALAVVYGPWNVFKKNGQFLSNAENVAYAMCHRFAWGCAVAWVIYASHNKMGGAVNAFLSWKVWLPLGRLTYNAYLLHFLVLFYFYFTQDTPVHYQDSGLVYHFVSNTVITYACAFVMAVTVEYPLLNLEKIVFKQ